MHKIFQTKRYGFTIIELVLVMCIISVIVPSMFSMYQFIINANKEIKARHETIEQGYEFFEKLNILMQDYTVDYEEYYNRQMVGCNEGGATGSGFTWNVGTGGYCKNFTAYGNHNSTKRKLVGSNLIASGYHDVYYCSSYSRRYSGTTPNPGSSRSPVIAPKGVCGKYGEQQSFGQYSKLFLDVKDVKATLGDNNPVGDSDDVNLGMPFNGVNAIEDSDHIQELYFISHDGKRRLYFRRKLVATKDNHTQYKIQMLRLRGFDAGRMHNFSITDGSNVGLYDGVIDTWACDHSMGFEPADGHRTSSVGGAYSAYYLPQDSDDCRIDLTHGSTTMLAWNVIISPINDSELYWADATRQTNAYMKILIVNGIYPPYYGTMAETAAEFKIPLQTIINMKDFYRN